MCEKKSGHEQEKERRENGKISLETEEKCTDVSDCKRGNYGKLGGVA